MTSHDAAAHAFEPGSDPATSRLKRALGRPRSAPYIGQPIPEDASLPGPDWAERAPRLEGPGVRRPDEGEAQAIGTGFSAAEACALVGLTYRQLDYWARTELLPPSITIERPGGIQRRYSYQDVVKLKVIKTLLDDGVSLGRARQAVQALDDVTDPRSPDVLIALSPMGATVTTTGQEVVDLLAATGGVLNLVPVASFISEIDERIREMAERDERQYRRGAS